MTEPVLHAALEKFIAQPDASAVGLLLGAASTFVIKHACSWQRSGLTFADRCREILSEMFLILREHVDTSRTAHPKGVLAYLTLRLRRLTRPHASKAVPFGLSEDLPDIGRIAFTPGRLQLVDELVSSVRTALATDDREVVRQLEFLFLHISPDLAGASRFLARSAGDDPDRRLEADKKRHQAFNRTLRVRFDDLVSGDWRDTTDWSGGERSHLAWRIISFSATEAGELGEIAHRSLEAWRDVSEPFMNEDIVTDNLPDRFSKLKLVDMGLTCLQRQYAPVCAPDKRGSNIRTQIPVPTIELPEIKQSLPIAPKQYALAEEAVSYGPTPEEDILMMLVAPTHSLVNSDTFKINDSEADWHSTPGINDSHHIKSSSGTAIENKDEQQFNQAVYSRLYAEAAHDVAKWWLTLTFTRSKEDQR
ncbi:MAG: hypothetical protein HQM09_23580 [Candidatus Riflebacteria bacterium]|nr:hypothetical protein [Candidatus Riflebacteria bacterium]